MTTKKEFRCTQCGDCCSNLGVEGVVVLQPQDIERISDYLGISQSHLLESYCEVNAELTETFECKVHHLKNTKGKCFFLRSDNLCNIHSVKPKQCVLGPTLFMSSAMTRYECMQGVELISTDNSDLEFFQVFTKES